MKKPKLTIEAYKSADGWRVRITHRNGNILLVSGEAYKRKGAARRMIKNAMESIVVGDYEKVGMTEKEDA